MNLHGIVERFESQILKTKVNLIEFAKQFMKPFRIDSVAYCPIDYIGKYGKKIVETREFPGVIT